MTALSKLTDYFFFWHRLRYPFLWVIFFATFVSFGTESSALAARHKNRVVLGSVRTPSVRKIATANYVSSSSAASDQMNGKTVADIRIEGLVRIEKEAVLAKLSTKPGSLVSAEQNRSDVVAVSSMGYFDDVALQAESVDSHRVILYVVVKERPVISKITFVGNERLSTSDLKDVVKIKEWSILDLNKVKDDVALIQKHYEEKGFYLAKVSFDIKTVEPEEDSHSHSAKKNEEVELIYKVSDYDKVQIKKITFLNNRKFTDSELKSALGETREGGFFSFLSGSGNFKESAFKQDLQRLTFFYYEHGYIKFRYENPVVTVSDDKKWLYISLYVDEGEPYKIGQIDFSGDLLFPKEELKEDLTLITDETFSVTKRNADLQKLTEKYQDLGYAFVNVVPKMNIHEDTHVIDLDYSFEKGNLAYFGEINVLGNSKTYDKVIRRELKIHEGELYSGSKLRISRENVERLGYFSPGEVIFNTVSAKGKPDVLNVEISVKERSTGTITLGAGYGSVQGFFFTTQISEINLLGRGQNLSLAATYSVQSENQSLNLGFLEPYTFDTLWTTGFDLYYMKFPIPNRYITSKLGFDIRVGHPIAEYTNAYLTYKNEGLKDLNVAAGIPADQVAADTGVLSSLTLSVVRDKRNNRFETSAGNYQSFSIETAGLGGDMAFVKWVANNRFYQRIVGDLVFRTSAEIGQITPLAGRPVPPSQKFFLGGPNNMKGWNMFSLGPQTFYNNAAQPLGGTVEAFSLFEIEHPIVKEAGIKAVLFFDVGNSWAQMPIGNPSEPFILRADAGFGFRWFSPIGPLRFEWGFPLAQRSYETSPVFQFFIGPPF